MVSALVPMKGESERVPAKNTRILGDRPLFYHILGSLSAAQRVGDIYVDTDSAKIKDLLRKDFPKVVIIDRPQALLGAKVSMTPIIAHDLTFIKTGHFLQTHATSPFLKPETIDRAIAAYFEGLSRGFDTAMGVTKFQTRFYDKDKRPINHDPDVMVPSQDMPAIYEDNSSFYINSVANFLKNNNRVGKNPLFIEIAKMEALDIDEEEDFALCEAVIKFRGHLRQAPSL